MAIIKNQKEETVKWYLKPVAVIIAILCAGPLALPLAWISPAFKKSHKIVITILVIVGTALFVKYSIELYRISLDHFREIQNMLSP